MNKVTAIGILALASSKPSRYLVLSDRASSSQSAFKKMAEMGEAAVERILKANGAQRIDMQNGSTIIFANASAGAHRGVEANMVILDEWRPTRAEMDGIEPVVQSTRGEIVQA